MKPVTTATWLMMTPVLLVAGLFVVMAYYEAMLRLGNQALKNAMMVTWMMMMGVHHDA